MPANQILVTQALEFTSLTPPQALPSFVTIDTWKGKIRFCFRFASLLKEGSLDNENSMRDCW
jgi:hypothetical protein